MENRGPAGPVVGLDYGTRRIGLAFSDPETGLALPGGVLERSRTLGADLEALAGWLAARSASRVVVGLPLHMDGRAGEMAAAARAFAEALAARTGLPVELLDERLTSAQAERSLREVAGRGGRSGGSRRRAARARRRGDVDTAAATLLLRTWLEHHSNRAVREHPGSRGVREHAGR